MTAASERVNIAARTTAEKMLEMFGGETLTVVLRPVEPEGDAGELGEATNVAVSLDIADVYAHATASGWELLMKADAVEDAMEKIGVLGAAELFAQCVQLRIAGRVLLPQRVVEVPAGGAAYLYRLTAKESA